jgi:Arc/MetJ family transcription regulator
MATNLALDDTLIEEARTLCGEKTKKATVTLALHELIRQRKKSNLLAAFGTIDFDPDWDPKAMRRLGDKRLILDELA